MALDPISIICRILDITTSLPSVIYWSWPTTLPNKRTVCPSVLQLSSRRHICVKCQRGIWPETLIWVVYNSRPTSLPSLMTVCLSVLQLSFKHTFCVRNNLDHWSDDCNIYRCRLLVMTNVSVKFEDCRSGGSPVSNRTHFVLEVTVTLVFDLKHHWCHLLALVPACQGQRP